MCLSIHENLHVVVEVVEVVGDPDLLEDVGFLGRLGHLLDLLLAFNVLKWNERILSSLSAELEMKFVTLIY